MPIGVIINSLSILVGGIMGALVSKYVTNDFKEQLSTIFGVCSIGMGVNAVILMENMPAVIFAVVLGTGLGLILHFGQWINKGGSMMQKAVSPLLKNVKTSLSREEFDQTLMTLIVLFCASGTGIYGTIVSGAGGDHSILIAKSILDLFTAMIFACSLGPVVALIAIPQTVIFILLFVLAGSIYPILTPSMFNDFKACGGFLMIATSFRMLKIKMLPTADMIPAMVIVMPFSHLWSTYVAPLL